ncbi:uncharacterized protein BDR25DRAFT_300851 [Lindgomyces ingoldianus]|uniref:Uncharacterized protein n=1 Tax=Lindgomyces ingoldianus TaxID=673940 RepID=A0ACB6RBX5_9PLEO|nr:uncharacterized protein BDR25DRAFT_300851 [Lindgomyces ingoldianus]KAF2476022.1 hypothetical protein BDR25DRAFT_300851 [Lindgomyces ingoldianus]
MEAIIEPFRRAHASGNGYAVSALLSPVAPPDDAGRLYDFYRASNEQQIEPEIRYALKYSKSSRISPEESNAWTDIFVLYWKAVGEILAVEEATNQGRLEDRIWVAVYDAWKALTDSIQRYVSNGTLPFWAVVCMYHAATNLRKFAIKADEQLASTKGNVTFNSGFQDDVVDSLAKTEKLEEAARLFNRMFALCLGDRNPDLNESRKWGTYYMANLQFKTYFKLKTINLSKNVVRSIEAQPDLPPLPLFPKAHQVTYKYYTGILAFLQEDYAKAEVLLTEAWSLCHVAATKNQELILTYLIPCRLVAKHNVPSQDLLARFPGLQRRFGPLVNCIKGGDLTGFDNALLAGEEEFVKRRIYLTLERGRDIALRNLLRKVFIAGGFEELKEGQTEADRIRRTRITLAEFAAALRMDIGGEGSGQVLEDDEVECMIANMIYKGLMKGYISREHAMVVLNKKGAFPGTGV